ncbi:Flp pilus assembly protein TadG [Roseivivax lentus]|uniref:Flp pilus assembly protein TadG n=1 Tax=Roseivivax lentus TaxID=633194 RepID=A0A1N7M8Y9_9RHOB|nr:TadE/TadG family type IV pilus assembly protein [Roseivivax lentus]SIS82547.1 Flp pilus assembly protein TadG [Roseivivax lentus]
MGPARISRIIRFRRCESGAALVEFVLCLPLMILFFVILIEFGRIFWAYQATTAGVRDASRYLARVAAVDICQTGGNLNTYAAQLRTMIETDRAGNSVLPKQVTVDTVTASHACVAGTFRVSPAPVATVSAQVTMQMPLGALFGIFGNPMSSVTTDISNSARIFGT